MVPLSKMNYSCFLCKKKKVKHIRRVGNSDIFRCCSCGLIFSHPQPKPEELEKLYSDFSYCAWGLNGRKNLINKQIQKIREETFVERLKEIQRYLSAGKILDIGCGTGFFLSLAKKEGWVPFGIEVSQIAGKEATRNLGKNIFIGSWEDFYLPDNFFDVITLFDVLEHISNLDPFLEKLYRMLVPDGLLVITTPNTNSFTSRLMGKHWLHYKLEHLYYFSPETLGRFLTDKGFSILEIAPARKTLNLQYIFNYFRLFKMKFLTALLTNLSLFLPNFITKIPFSISWGEMLVIAKQK